MSAARAERSRIGTIHPMNATDRTILVGMDASETAGDALALARVLEEPLGARTSAVYVHPYGAAEGVLGDEKYREVTRELADSVHSHMRDLAVPVEERELRLVADRSPARGLQRTAEAGGAALIAIGSSRRSRVGRVFPGGTGERLLAGSPCPVAVATRGFAGKAAPLRMIGCAFDGTEESHAALTSARALASATQGKVLVLAVHEPLVGAGVAEVKGVPFVPVNAALRSDLERQLAEAEGKLREHGITVRGKLLDGDAARALAEESRGLDVLVTGSRGYGPKRAVLVGSVSGELLRTAECPVVVVPRGA